MKAIIKVLLHGLNSTQLDLMLHLTQKNFQGSITGQISGHFSGQYTTFGSSRYNQTTPKYTVYNVPLCVLLTGYTKEARNGKLPLHEQTVLSKIW